MTHLDQLYQQTILDHNRNPRNFGEIDPVNHECEGHNPLCGDDYKLFLNIQGDMVENIGYTGAGCAISKASASLMSEAVKGKSLDEITALKDKFIETLTTDIDTDKVLGKLRIFEGVKRFPIRVKCATLIWRTLERAIEQGSGSVTTE